MSRSALLKEVRLFIHFYLVCSVKRRKDYSYIFIWFALLKEVRLFIHFYMVYSVKGGKIIHTFLSGLLC